MSQTFLLAAENLAIMRGERVLFREISLQVGEGDAIILRGANGSGKSTLLRILAGLTRPEIGTVVRNSPHHWLGHTNSIKPDETPEQHLRRWALAWGADASATSQTWVRDLADIPSRLLSAGQKRRTALARLQLQHRPLWLLDEPFNALDTHGRDMLLAQISEHRSKGGAIIAAIHGEAGFAATREVTL